MADEQVSLSYVIDTNDVKAAERAMKALKSGTDEAAASADRLEGAAKRASGSTANFGRSALEVGRITQDFAQGGFGGIINNLEGFARAVGGGPGLAGALTLLGVGFLLLKEPIKGFVASMSDGGREIPKSADAVERLSEALKDTREKLDKLKEGWDGSAASLAEYNRLTAEQIRLEREADAAKKARAITEGPTKEDKAAAPAERIRAEFLRDSTEWGAGEAKAVRDAVAEGARERIQLRMDEIDAALAEAVTVPEFVAKRGADGRWANVRNPLFLQRRDRDRRLKAERDRLAAQQGGVDADADSLIAGVAAGDEAAIRRAMSATPDAAIRGTLGRALGRPESLRRGKEEADRERDAAEVEAMDQKRRQDMENRSAKFEADKAAAEAKARAEDEARTARNIAHWQRFNQSDTARAEAGKREAEKERAERAERLRAGQEGRQRADLQRFAASRGVDIPSEQLGPVLDDMRRFMGSGAAPMEAALGAVRAFVQANQATLDRLQAMEREFQMLGGHALQQFARARQGQQMNPSLLNRGGG